MNTEALDTSVQNVLLARPEIPDMILADRLMRFISSSEGEATVARDIASSAVQRVREALEARWAVPFRHKPGAERSALARLKEAWLLRYLKRQYEYSGVFPYYDATQDECIRIFKSQIDNVKIRVAREQIEAETDPSIDARSETTYFTEMADTLLAKEAVLAAEAEEAAPTVKEGADSGTKEEASSNDVDEDSIADTWWYEKHGFDRKTVKAQVAQGHKVHRKMSREVAELLENYVLAAKWDMAPPSRKLRRVLQGLDNTISFAVLLWLTVPEADPHKIAMCHEAVFPKKGTASIAAVRVAAFELGPPYDAYLARLEQLQESAPMKGAVVASTVLADMVSEDPPPAEDTNVLRDGFARLLQAQGESIERAVDRCFAGLVKSLRTAEVQEVKARVEEANTTLTHIAERLAKGVQVNVGDKLESLSKKLDNLRTHVSGDTYEAVRPLQEKVASLEEQLRTQGEVIQDLTEQVAKLEHLNTKADAILEAVVAMGEEIRKRPADPTLMEILDYGHKIRVEPVVNSH